MHSVLLSHFVMNGVLVVDDIGTEEEGPTQIEGRVFLNWFK